MGEKRVVIRIFWTSQTRLASTLTSEHKQCCLEVVDAVSCTKHGHELVAASMVDDKRRKHNTKITVSAVE